jgi:hypothetical protein
LYAKVTLDSVTGAEKLTAFSRSGVSLSESAMSHFFDCRPAIRLGQVESTNSAFTFSFCAKPRHRSANAPPYDCVFGSRIT